MRQVTDKENMASVFMTYVMTLSAQSKSSTISLSRALNGVSPNDKAVVRAGIEALLEHHLLTRQGDEIGLSVGGKVFLAYMTAVGAASPTLEEDIKDHPILDHIREVIAKDSRFNPAPIGQTPTAALTSAQSDESGIWNIWTILFLSSLA